MTPDVSPLEASVRAFRDVTAAPADGLATRARVIEAAGRQLRRRVIGRRAAVGAAVVLAAGLSGSAAWTAIARWRAQAVLPVAAVEPVVPRVVAAHVGAEAPGEAPPTSGTSDVRRPDVDEREARLYARAHRAHFFEDNPQAALAAWDQYLRGYPHGAFVPEARYNRAFCLLRLGQRQAAVQALRPFAAGAFADYRRQEATALLDWIARQVPDPAEKKF
jgi:TolA-binding protein